MRDLITTGSGAEIVANGGKVIVASTGARLTGGTLALGPSSLITGATAAATLTNISCNMIGSGQLGGGQLTLVNQVNGAIIAGSDTAPLVIDTGVNTIINAGKIECFSAGGMQIKSAFHNTGVLLAQGATGIKLVVTGAVTGAGTVQIGGAVADFTSTFNENVTFFAPGIGSPVSGTLELAHGRTYNGTISGFSTAGNTFLDLNDIAFVSGVTEATYSGNTTSGVLTVSDGRHTAHIILAGNYTSSTFTVSSDGHGGTVIHDPPAPQAFASGADDSKAGSETPPRSSLHLMTAATASLGGYAGPGLASQAPAAADPLLAQRLFAPRAALA